MKSQSPALAPKPSPPSYSSTDCSQPICSPPYCLQWCPSNTAYPNDPNYSSSSSSSTISPLLIALITALAAALLCLLYYTFSSRLCKPRRPHPSRNDAVEEERRLHAHLDQIALQDMLGPSIQIQPWTPAAVAVTNSDGGLDDRFIKSITVFKYRRGDGLVESTDCAVCLTEFNEEESLRLMPNCQHAFHPPCIDTWLRSHSNCPICRALMVGAPAPVPAPSASGVSRMRVQSGGDVVVMVDAGVQVSVVDEIVSDGRDLDRRRQVSSTATEGEVVGEKEKGRHVC